MKYKFQIGDLVVFQKPHMDVREWEKGEKMPYQTGMITFRDKAGYKTIREHIQNVKTDYHFSQRQTLKKLPKKNFIFRGITN